MPLIKAMYPRGVQATDFDLKGITFGSPHFLSTLSNLVYTDWGDLGMYLASNGFHHFNFFDVDGAQALALTHEKETVIAFRGTEMTGMNDFLYDLKFIQVSFSNNKDEIIGKVHRGFNFQFNYLWKEIKPYIDSYDFVNYSKFTLTGHSLGAALATLYAGYLGDSVVKSLYTFGSPRAGNKEFANYVNSLNIERKRIVNNKDIVTRIPPEFLGYKHINDSFNTFEKDQRRWWISISDHQAHLYDQRLAKNNLFEE